MRYLIIPASRVSEVRFAQVLESGPNYLRYNGDNTKTFIKWNTIEIPDCINNILNSEGEYWGPYSKDEFMEILKTDEWSVDIQGTPSAEGTF